MRLNIIYPTVIELKVKRLLLILKVVVNLLIRVLSLTTDLNVYLTRPFQFFFPKTEQVSNTKIKVELK